MKTPAEHLATLRQFQAWRLGDDEIAQPESKEITAALEWAIAELDKENDTEKFNQKCPFCGSIDLEPRGCDESVYVGCNTCNAEGPVCADEEEALLAWNNRPDGERRAR